MEDNAKEERSIMPDKILVVDDEVEIADLIEVYLNKIGRASCRERV